MGKNTVWKASDGHLYHDSCFDEGETREGYEEVDRDDLDESDECESCGGLFAKDNLTDDVEEDEVDVDDDEDDVVDEKKEG